MLIIINMNINKKLLLIILICWFSYFPGSGQVHMDPLFNYEKSKTKGESLYGQRIGKWIETDTSGTIYGEYNYDSIGNPINIWFFNFPNGSKRFETEYTNKDIIRIAFYLGNQKTCEIKADSIISNKVYTKIRFCEEKIFNHFQNIRIVTDDIEQPTFLNIIGFNYFESLMEITTILKKHQFAGSVKIWNAVWSDIWEDKNEEYRIRRSYIYIGRDEYRTSYIYSGRRIKRKDEYLNSTLIHIIKYTKNGESKN